MNKKPEIVISKEMYIIGIHHTQKNTRTDHMLAILNFVFAVTSIVVTCCKII